MPSNTTFKFLSLNNGTEPQGAHDAGSGEANLDIQYTVGIATGVPVQFLGVGGGETEADIASAFVDTTIFLDDVRNPPSVMTTSYGFDEPDVGSSMAMSVLNLLESAQADTSFPAKSATDTWPLAHAVYPWSSLPEMQAPSNSRCLCTSLTYSVEWCARKRRHHSLQRHRIRTRVPCVVPFCDFGRIHPGRGPRNGHRLHRRRVLRHISFSCIPEGGNRGFP